MEPVIRRASRSLVFPAGSRLAMALQYDGWRYNGWQLQKAPDMPSVQAELEKALSSVAARTVSVQCAGRTDSGVHASHQVVHFDAPVDRPETAWLLGVNARLPEDIAVKWVCQVDGDFNARFSALARRYRYIFYCSPQRPAHLVNSVTWVSNPLDALAMHEAAQHLLGERDFTSFRAAGCQSRTPMRNVHHANVSRHGDFVVLDIQANAFLHHMVRNIAGSLLKVGIGEQPPGWIGELMEIRDRCQAAATASASGLYLVDVKYPDSFGLPLEVPGPMFAKPWF